MKESAQAALSLVKARASSLGVDPAGFEKSDIHVHVPAGAIPKDGPSAGVAMFIALVSLLTGRTVRSDTAMTGEISLRGLVLPIGGVKNKVLAAVRAGITTVMLPERNKKDYEDVPEAARNAVRFVWLSTVDDAIAAALEPAPSPRPVAARQRRAPRSCERLHSERPDEPQRDDAAETSHRALRSGCLQRPHRRVSDCTLSSLIFVDRRRLCQGHQVHDHCEGHG